MIRDTIYLVAELVLLFFGIAFGVQLLQRRIGSGRLQDWLGGNAIISALKGIIIGFITPFCTFSAVPMLIGFRQAGIRTSGYVAFIVAAPVLDPVLFGALVLIVGWLAAGIYLAVAFSAALGLALAADTIGIDRHLKPLPMPSAVSSAMVAGGASRASSTKNEPQPASCSSACDRSNHSGWQGWRAEASSAASSATALLRSVALVLSVGVAVGLLIEAVVSPETTARITGDNGLWSIPVAAILGTPLYFSTALFVPIADSLKSAGVGIGAIVALTISGAGASFPEFLLLTKLANLKILAVFFGYVLAIALTGGLLAQAIIG